MKNEITIYHNPRCSKSRNAVCFLDEMELPYAIENVHVVEYLKNTLNKSELSDLLKKIGIKAEELIRKGEPDYKENYKGKTLSESDWINAMVKYPKLIERPIVVFRDKAVVARPKETINKLFI